MTNRSFRACALIPTFDNPRTIEKVVRAIGRYLADVVVVDDGSAAPARSIIDGLARTGLVQVCRHEQNRGKGAAIMTGFAYARTRGYTHAFQIDADGQHGLQSIPEFLAAAEADSQALILGYPVFDESVPTLRRTARKLSRFWVNIETGGSIVVDPMIGFRVYPLESAMRCGTCGSRMEFDIEIAVRMVWAGVRVVNLPVAVMYPRPEEGGVSHFRPIRDNLRITWLHTRLTCFGVMRAMQGSGRRPCSPN